MPTGDLNLNSTSNSVAQGHGKQWCNGDCDWIDGQCKSGHEKFVNFYSSDDYIKDETTSLMMAPTTEETCRDSEGFSCQGRLCDLFVVLLFIIFIYYIRLDTY